MRENETPTLKPVSTCGLQAFITDRLQLFSIIESILDEIGSARMSVTSFSVSEEFIRKIFRMKQSGKLLNARLVVDQKAAAKTARIIHFAGNVFDSLYFSKNHSRVVLLNNDTHSVSIITSQNLTRGNRKESTVITTDPVVFCELATDMDVLISESVKVCGTE